VRFVVLASDVQKLESNEKKRKQFNLNAITALQLVGELLTPGALAEVHETHAEFFGHVKGL
jgi:hypothetical protein